MEKRIIVETIIVIIVVFVVILIPTRGWSIVNYFMDMGEEPETMANTPQPIIDEANNIFTDYEECFNSKDNNCLCDISFIAFPERYLLIYLPTRLDFSRIKEDYYGKGYNFMEPEATIGSLFKVFQKKNINCYITYKNKVVSIENINDASYLLLDYPSSVVFSIGTTTTSYDFLNKKPTFYKKDNIICFVLEDQLSKDEINEINKLHKCSPKPLNTP